jgi:hypothetical protein
MTSPDTAQFAGTPWRKSSYSGGGNNCVEVARATAVGVRDSKSPEDGHLTFTPQTWNAFLAEVKLGTYDL